MNLHSEPARVIGLASTFLAALVNAAVLFGLPIDEGQKAAILSVFNTGAILAATLFIRGFVYSPESYENKPSPTHTEETGPGQVI